MHKSQIKLVPSFASVRLMIVNIILLFLLFADIHLSALHGGLLPIWRTYTEVHSTQEWREQKQALTDQQTDWHADF